MMGIEMNRVKTVMRLFVMDMTIMICFTSIGDGAAVRTAISPWMPFLIFIIVVLSLTCILSVTSQRFMKSIFQYITMKGALFLVVAPLSMAIR